MINLLVFITVLILIILLVEKIAPRGNNRNNKALFVSNEVMAFDTHLDFPDIGDAENIYYDMFHNSFYRWTGEGYTLVLKGSQKENKIPQEA